MRRWLQLDLIMQNLRFLSLGKLVHEAFPSIHDKQPEALSKMCVCFFLCCFRHWNSVCQWNDLSKIAPLYCCNLPFVFIILQHSVTESTSDLLDQFKITCFLHPAVFNSFHLISAWDSKVCVCVCVCVCVAAQGVTKLFCVKPTLIWNGF